MRIGAIVQVRMDSQRLPGKVLRPVAGKPVLQYLLERLSNSSQLAGIVVATSVSPTDEPIARFCAGYGAACYRGPLEDVSERMLGAAERHGFGAFVRVCGDSPLLDHRLVDQAVTLYLQGEQDLVTNVFPRTFPRGQSVEVVAAGSLRRARRRMTTAEHREHVTRIFYEEPGEYRIVSFSRRPSVETAVMSVDTEEDAQRVEAMVALMTKPHWHYGVDELVGLLDRLAASAQGHPTS